MVEGEIGESCAKMKSMKQVFQGGVGEY